MLHNLETHINIKQNHDYISNYLTKQDNQCTFDLKLDININDATEQNAANHIVQSNQFYELLIAIRFDTEACYEIAYFVLDTNTPFQIFEKEQINITIPDMATHVDFMILLRDPVNNTTVTWHQHSIQRFKI